MAKRKKKVAAEQAAYDERTRRIGVYRAGLRKRIEDKQTAQPQA
jgi:hypothetical protein